MPADFTYLPDYVLEEEIGYGTLVSNFENGVEQRRAKRSSSIRKFSLNFNFRTKTDMQTIRDFFIAKLGQLTSFTWVNPNDSATYNVRFQQDSFKFSLVAPNIYSFKFDFVQVL